MNRLVTLFLFLFLFISGMAVLLRISVAFFLPGVRVTSWFRSPAKNAAVGGAKRSAHLLGWGIDFIPVTSDNVAKARRFAPFVLNEGDHVHIGWY